VLGPHQQLVTVNGLFRPFALVRGRAAASWSMPRGEVVIEPFGRLSKADAAALERDAEDVVRFLSGEGGVPSVDPAMPD
jgi:DNA glycosylase AlkZ-like